MSQERAARLGNNPGNPYCRRLLYSLHIHPSNPPAQRLKLTKPVIKLKAPMCQRKCVPRVDRIKTWIYGNAKKLKISDVVDRLVFQL
jgi:hypothetical protein